MTYRDSLDWQNNMHVQMRYSRKLLTAYKAAGQKEPYIEQLTKYRAQMKEYRDFSKAMGIDDRRQNVRLDGLGTMTNWKEAWSL